MSRSRVMNASGLTIKHQCETLSSLHRKVNTIYADKNEPGRRQRSLVRSQRSRRIYFFARQTTAYTCIISPELELHHQHLRKFLHTISPETR
jgi:hypothetical protein